MESKLELIRIWTQMEKYGRNAAKHLSRRANESTVLLHKNILICQTLS